MKGKLYLIPSPLGEYDPALVLPAPVLELLHTINCYVVEEVRTARRFLSAAGLKGHIEGLEFHTLNEHSSKEDIEALGSLFDKGDVGLISEAGRSALKEVERLSKALNQSQIFIETPYRNDALLGDLLKFLQPSTRLTVAADITLPTAFIRTLTVAQWRKAPVTIGKRPCVFIILV